MNKVFKFLFPTPSIIILIILGILLSNSTIDERNITVGEWFITLFALFCLVIFPFDIIWYFKKRIKRGGKKTQTTVNGSPINQTKQSNCTKSQAPKNDYIDTSLFEEIKPPNGIDSLFFKAGYFIVKNNRASMGMLQRAFKISFNRACCLMDQLVDFGVVGKEFGVQPREILMSLDEYYFFVTNFYCFYSELYNKDSAIQKNDQMASRIQMYNNKYDYMEGHDFEYFCADLLRKNGFYDITVTPGSGDQGIDLIAFKDGVKYGIQCKCYSSDIGNKAVQEAFSGAKFYDCHVPVVLTNRFFTKSAIELSKKVNVLLWDRDYLDKLIANEN